MAFGMPAAFSAVTEIRVLLPRSCCVLVRLDKSFLRNRQTGFSTYTPVV